MHDLLLGTVIRKAQPRDLTQTKAILDRNKDAVGFVRSAGLARGIHNGEVLVGEYRGVIVGILHYHHRLDNRTTIHQLVVAEGIRRSGLGRTLIRALEEECHERGQKLLRLKCPIELPANGFYGQLGFQRIAVEPGKWRALVVWEKSVDRREVSKDMGTQFFITLTNDAGSIRRVVELWDESGDPRNPFQQIIFTPLFSSASTITEIRRLKEERGAVVMFDSGGYQVQMGKISYEELFDRLQRFYEANRWADWYVLPDHVPGSADSDEEVEFKVQETIDFARMSLRRMPNDLMSRALGVTHGRTSEQIRRCVEAYAKMGVRYVGFGSFGTSGPNGAVNVVSRRSLSLLDLTQTLAHEYDLRLHVLGIGSPGYLVRLADAGIIPSSFDSAGWWKAGGFGYVLFPGGRSLRITETPRQNASLADVQRSKEQTSHFCYFCTDLRKLRSSRITRIMHNLTATLDAVDQMRW